MARFPGCVWYLVEHAPARRTDGLGCYFDLLLFFFFQAEDGIRDLTVTGVQTCALPISNARSDIPVSIPSPGACSPPCTAAGCGPCASMPAWAMPRSPTVATAIYWRTEPRVSRSLSTCPRR